jgi:hypothetical protein
LAGVAVTDPCGVRRRAIHAQTAYRLTRFRGNDRRVFLSL